MTKQGLISDYVHSGEFLKFNGKRALFATSEIANPAYFVYLLGIARHLQKINCEVDFVFFINPSERKFEKAIKFFEQELNRFELNNSKVTPISILPALDKYDNVMRQLDLMESIAEFKNLKSEFKHLSNSIYSTYCSSYSLTSDPAFSLRRFGNKHLSLAEEFLVSYERTVLLLGAHKYDAVFFFNGRYPSQSGIKEAAEDSGVGWFAVEHGSVPEDSVHVEKFQTQDRESIQNFIQTWSAGLKLNDSETFTRESLQWLERQQGDSRQNPFLRTSAAGYCLKNRNRELATIFTSSLDEEIACPGWGNDDIRSLIERTVRFSKKLTTLGFDPVVVIHPNTANKTWHDLSLMSKIFSKENISFIPPWAPVSSYQLAEQSVVIATWRSTIGLEMVARQVSINLLSESHYDLLLKPLMVTDDSLSYCHVNEGNQDSKLANLIIYYYSHHGYKLESLLGEIPLSFELMRFRKILVDKNFVLGVRRRLKVIFVLVRGFRATPNEYSKFLRPIFGIKITNIFLDTMQSAYSKKFIYKSGRI